MTDLVEVPQWTPGIYQLETNDPVMGGLDGIDNRQAKQLADRTAYLKAQQEVHSAAADPHPQYMTSAESDAAIAAAVAALVNSSPAALDTLAEFAAALGNDPNFAATITGLLATKAPLASPALTGAPTAPTQPQFDATTKLATMEALQRALGNYRGWVSYAASQTLTSAHVGKVVAYGAATPAIYGLPLVADVTLGAAILIVNNGPGALTVQPQAPNAMYATDATNLASIVLSKGEWLEVFCNGNAWNSAGGSVMLDYAGGRLGVNQTRQNVTASRALSTTYTNTTGRPIWLQIKATSTTVPSSLTLTVGGIAGPSASEDATGYSFSVETIVLPGETYSAAAVGLTIDSWVEIR